MANSNGIDYFPFNVDFFDDDKLALIESEFGLKGSIIAIRLLCKIYKEGYYYQWGDDECLLFARKAGAGIVPSLVGQVVNGLVKRSFFNKELFDSFKILTSRGIQSRYFDAVKRRQHVEVKREYLLVDVSKYSNVHILGANVDITTKNADISAQSKVKESKVEESKRKTPPLTPPHGVASSSKEAELSFGNSIFQVRNIDEFTRIAVSLGAGSEYLEELKRMSNEGDPESPVWYLFESMKKSQGRISMSELVATMSEYERRGMIKCKSRNRVMAERLLPEVVKKEEIPDILNALTCKEREIRLLQNIGEIRKSNGKIRLPGKYILSELHKVQ